MFGTIATMRVKPGEESGLLKVLEDWGSARGSQIDGPLRVLHLTKRAGPERSAQRRAVRQQRALPSECGRPGAGRVVPVDAAIHGGTSGVGNDHEVLLAYEFVPPVPASAMP